MPTILLMLILFVDDDAETVSFYPYSEQNVHECVTVASSLNRRLDRIRDLRNDDVVDHELGKVWRFRNVDASNVDDARFECDVVSVEPRPSRATTERAQQEHEALLGRIAVLAQEEQLRQPTVEELTTPARKSRKQAQRPEEEAPAAASKASLAGLPAADQAWVRSSCSRVLGPAVWASCVEREVRAIRAGMPDISEFPAPTKPGSVRVVRECWDRQYGQAASNGKCERSGLGCRTSPSFPLPTKLGSVRVAREYWDRQYGQAASNGKPKRSAPHSKYK